MLVLPLGDSAMAQGCAVLLCKEAPQLPPAESEDDLVFFTFDIEQGPGSDSFEIAANERCLQFGFIPQAGIQIVEQPLEGWTLADIDCQDVAGITTTFIENGVVLNCNAQTSEINIECDFVNLRPSAIPTLSEWGMISVAVGLVLIGVFFAVRRKRAQAV
jgi:hypothetical protein